MADRPTDPNTACVRNASLPASRLASRGVRQSFASAWRMANPSGRGAQGDSVILDPDVHTL